MANSNFGSPFGGGSGSGGASASNFAASPTNGGAYLSDPSILFTGDSTVSQSDTVSLQVSGSATQAMTRYQKTVGWIDAITKGVLNYDTMHDLTTNTRKGNNAGVGGTSLTELLTRLVTGDSFSGNSPLLSRPEKYVWVQCGTNDINAGGTALGQAGFLPTLITNTTNVITAITNAGKIPIMTTVLPRNNVDGGGGFDWGTAGGTTAAQKRLVLNSYNRWLVNYCKNLNILCVNWTAAFSNSTGDAVTGYTVEGLHPNGRGAWYLAQAAIEQLNGLLPVSYSGSPNAYDVYDATYNPYGNILNGALSGSVSSPNAAFSVGAGTGTVTGTLPTGFQIAKTTSTSTDIVTSLVTRNGQTAIKLVWTSYGTGVTSEEWRLSYWTGASTTLSSWANLGDYTQMECAMEVESGTLGVLRSFGMRFATNSGFQYTASTISFDAATNTINDSANGFTSFVTPAGLALNIAGSVSNNRVIRVISVTNGTITVSPLTPLVTEAAGSAVTIRLPSSSTNVGAVSSENAPNENTGMFGVRCPTYRVPYSVNTSPRMGFFTNGTIAGTATIYIYAPFLGKMAFVPSVLQYTATDT